jgi:hypothetical protein
MALGLSGFLTWLVWGVVHILSLPQLQPAARAAPVALVVFTGHRLIPEPLRTPGGEPRRLEG